MTISLSKAKELCDKSELETVQAASPSRLKKLSQAELEDQIRRARKLRDKWRTQSTKQRRKSQTSKGQRDTDVGGRSKEKAELFEQVHERLADQLQKVRSSSEGKQSKGTSPRREKPRKADRTIKNRAERSTLRQELDQRRDEKNRKTKAAERKRTKSAKSSSKKQAAEPDAERLSAQLTSQEAAASQQTRQSGANTRKGSTAKGAKQASGEKKSGSAKVAPPKMSKSRRERVAQLEARDSESPGTDEISRKATRPLPDTDPAATERRMKKANLSAKANEVQTRVKRGGGPRILGHVASQNKRSQARRDSR